MTKSYLNCLEPCQIFISNHVHLHNIIAIFKDISLKANRRNRHDGMKVYLTDFSFLKVNTPILVPTKS